MIYGWWVAAILLVILMILAVAYRRLKNQLRQKTAETTHLAMKLSAVRKDLAEVNARRKKLLAASNQALIIVEGDYTISSANKVARRLFGKIDTNTSLMKWTRQHQLQELVDQTLQGKKMPPLYFSSGDLNFEVQARSIKEEKQVVAVALAIHDVTELQRLSRARRDFVANISHELRTPLASIQLLTETLLGGVLSDEKMATELVDKIAAQTETLSQLAQELLDLSMIESGQTPLKMGPYSLKAVAQNHIERLRPQARRKNLALHLDIAENVIVLIDETMIGRVITNLVHNAIKFTDSGSVTLSAQPPNGAAASDMAKDNGDWVVLSVSDTGIGISPDELPRIFERFYIIDRARNRKVSGTGLGLAIVKHIVEGHGGRIWAESDGQTGTTFYLTLPVEE